MTEGSEEEEKGSEARKASPLATMAASASGGLLLLSLKLWPPSQRTREAVVHYLVETLADQSLVSDRYGAVPCDEASVAARRIEEEAFSAVGDGRAASGKEEEVEFLHAYSWEISGRLLQSAKARGAAAGFVDAAPFKSQISHA